jgi:hypothetical protein
LKAGCILLPTSAACSHVEVLDLGEAACQHLVCYLIWPQGFEEEQIHASYTDGKQSHDPLPRAKDFRQAWKACWSILFCMQPAPGSSSPLDTAVARGKPLFGELGSRLQNTNLPQEGRP